MPGLGAILARLMVIWPPQASLEIALRPSPKTKRIQRKLENGDPVSIIEYNLWISFLLILFPMFNVKLTIWFIRRVLEYQ